MNGSDASPGAAMGRMTPTRTLRRVAGIFLFTKRYTGAAYPMNAIALPSSVATNQMTVRYAVSRTVRQLGFHAFSPWNLR